MAQCPRAIENLSIFECHPVKLRHSMEVIVKLINYSISFNKSPRAWGGGGWGEGQSAQLAFIATEIPPIHSLTDYIFMKCFAANVTI